MDAATPNPDLTPKLTLVLALVRSLMDAGRRVADTLRQATDTRELRYRAHLFFTGDITHMLARIARGLRRAAALESWLLRRVQRGRDLKVAPLRVPVRRAPSASPQPRTKPPPLPLDPSDEEIAADIRRRSIGAVIVDICLDLGVQLGDLGRDMHEALMSTAMSYGGHPLRLLRLDEGMRRTKQIMPYLRLGMPIPPELEPFPIPFVPTGPPA